MESITLEMLESNMDFFSRMYDAIRLVDPIEKNIVRYLWKSEKGAGDACYAFWGEGKVCDNCISVRAHLAGKSFMKLEKSKNAVLLVTALPVKDAEEPTVVEMLQNVTDTMLIGPDTHTETHLMRDYIKALNEGVIKDKLTGAYNRRYVDERLPADVARAAAGKTPLSVIFLDIDNLKDINDVHGHLYGDSAIKKIADVLSHSIRTESDWAARYGGDEFLVCLGGAPASAALQIAKRILSKIRELPISEDKDVRATVSIGVHTMEGEPLTPQELISKADEKMYRAKQQGKNRIA